MRGGFMLVVKAVLFFLLLLILLGSIIQFSLFGSFEFLQVSFCTIVVLAMILSFIELRCKKPWLRNTIFILKFLMYVAFLLVGSLVLFSPASQISLKVGNSLSVFLDVFWWLVVTVFIGQVVNRYVFYSIERATGVQLPAILTGLFYGVLYGLAFIAVLTFVFQYEVTALLAASGIFTIIIGLAVRANLSNIFSGLFLVMDHPFKSGDFVTIDSHEGFVDTVGFRATTIVNSSNQQVIIPNEKVAQATVINHSALGEAGHGLSIYYRSIYIHPGHDINSVKQIILNSMMGTKPVDGRAQFSVTRLRIEGISEQGIQFTIGIDTLRKDLWGNLGAVLIKVHSDLSRLGIRSVTGFLYQKIDSIDGLPVEKGLRTATENFQIKNRHKTFSKERGKSNIYTESVSDKDVISDVPLFKVLSNQQIDFLASASCRQCYKAGQAIVERGAEGDSMFIIIDGVVRIKIYHNNISTTVALLGLHDYFGEMSMLTGAGRTATVEAVGDVIVLEVEADAMKVVFKENPEVLEAVASVVAERQLENQAAVVDNKTKEKKVETYGEKIMKQMKAFFGLKEE